MNPLNNFKNNNGIDSQSWGKRGTAGVSIASTLSFENVDVVVSGKKILQNIDLNLKAGEVSCLLGSSGSGKSTILRAAAGIQKISSGMIKINNQIVSSDKFHLEPQKRGVGLMFQDFALFPHMTLLENIIFGLTKLKGKEKKHQALAALNRVGLIGRENDYPHMLSGGQQQRLALARTIAPRPGIIMLDEPFSGLDERMREIVRTETMAVLREINATTIIVTHHPEEAMLMGDKIILLDKGKIIQNDSAHNIYYHPKNIEVARFFSPLSEIDAIVNNGYVDTPLGKIKTPNKADGQKVIIALRPNDAIELYSKSPGIRGRLVSKKEALGVDIYEVQVANMEQLITVRQRSNPQLCVGCDVFLRLKLQHILVFDRN